MMINDDSLQNARTFRVAYLAQGTPTVCTRGQIDHFEKFREISFNSVLTNRIGRRLDRTCFEIVSNVDVWTFPKFLLQVIV